MNIQIINPVTHRVTVYTQSELKRDARLAAKGKGKLLDYYVSITEGKEPRLAANVQSADGWCETIFVAI